MTGGALYGIYCMVVLQRNMYFLPKLLGFYLQVLKMFFLFFKIIFGVINYKVLEFVHVFMWENGKKTYYLGVLNMTILVKILDFNSN